MIPRIIHRVWLGGNPMPQQYESWWQGWQRQLPHFEFKTWTDKDVTSLSVFDRIQAADSGAKKADIARYEILHRYGGTYLDCDFMPLNYCDFSAFDADLVVCHEREEDDGKCSNGFFSISPNHPLMAKAIAAVSRINLNSVEVIQETGPGFFGQLIADAQYLRLPTISLYPYLYNEPFHAVFPRDLGATYGIHVWYNSWFSDNLKVLKLNSMLLSGDIEEAVKISHNNNIGEVERKNVDEYVSSLRSVRNLIAEVSHTSVLQRLLRMDDQRCFELFKVGYYLIKKNPSAVVWHIGAGDGIAGSPLRPLLVNFDPVAVLVEPRPDRLAALTANYARNRNVRIVGPAALAGDGFHDPDQLRHACGNPAPDIMVVTADDAGAAIAVGLLDRGVQPSILYLGSGGWGQDSQGALEARLQRTYEIVDFGHYRIACRRDFFWEYCRDLFVEHGLPTVYRQVLRTIIREDRPAVEPSA